MPASSRRRALVFAAILGVSACGPSQEPAPPASADPSGAPPVGAVDDCYESELLGPDGSRLDLTGTWQLAGEGGHLYFVSQVGSCVFWAGGFPSSPETADQAESPWGLTTTVFEGTVGSDFVLVGRRAEVRHGPQSGGALDVEVQEWEIQFLDGVAAELTTTYGAGSEDGAATATLRKLSSEFLEPLAPAP